MAYSIITGTLIQEGASEWYEGIPCDQDQLRAELEALAVPGVRTYSSFGRSGEVSGVYPWSDSAPLGEYLHTDDPLYSVIISAADEQRIRATILNHVPSPA